MLTCTFRLELLRSEVLKKLFHVSQNMFKIREVCTLQNINSEVALMWLEIVQALESNMDIIDHKLLIPEHSILPNDRDIDAGEMSLQRIIYDSFFKIIKKCRKGNDLIVNKMRKVDFVSTKFL